MKRVITLIVALCLLLGVTGCSLSALVAGFLAIDANALEATAAAMMLAKRAEEKAFSRAQAPGAFRAAYIDALYEITQGATQ